jgi:hypothetical protein
MRREVQLLALAGSAAVGVACNASVANSPTAAYYDAEVVERLAPDCLEAGYDAVVCGCTLRMLAEERRDPSYLLLEMPSRAGSGWPGEESGALARWHASCEGWAVVLGLQAPSVAAGPPR